MPLGRRPGGYFLCCIAVFEDLIRRWAAGLAMALIHMSLLRYEISFPSVIRCYGVGLAITVDDKVAHITHECFVTTLCWSELVFFYF